MSDIGWIVAMLGVGYGAYHHGYRIGLLRGFHMMADLIREELAKDREVQP